MHHRTWCRPSRPSAVEPASARHHNPSYYVRSQLNQCFPDHAPSEHVPPFCRWGPPSVRTHNGWSRCRRRCRRGCGRRASRARRARRGCVRRAAAPCPEPKRRHAFAGPPRRHGSLARRDGGRSRVTPEARRHHAPLPHALASRVAMAVEAASWRTLFRPSFGAALLSPHWPQVHCRRRWWTSRV